LEEEEEEEEEDEEEEEEEEGEEEDEEGEEEEEEEEEPGKRTILNHAVDRSIIVYGFACVPARGYLSGDYSLFYDTTNLE
ncbi:hypothetical protein V1477_018837, partial [Vespula maculifrons]